MGKKQKKQNLKTQHQSQTSKVDEKTSPVATADVAENTSDSHVEDFQETDVQTPEMDSLTESFHEEEALTTPSKEPSPVEEKTVPDLGTKDAPAPKSKKNSTKSASHLAVGSSIQRGGKSGTVVWVGKYPDGRKMKVKWESGSFEIVAEKDLV